MGWFKDAIGIGTGIATGGLYSTSGGGLLQGGGLEGLANTATGGSYGLAKEGAHKAWGTQGYLNQNNGSSDPSAGMVANNNYKIAQSKQSGIDKQNRFYGSSLDNIGQESADYANMLKGNLNKNVAKADQYNQQAGQQRGLDNARAGLSGVDTSAMNEQGRRNASFGAAAINEDAQRQALDLYGQSISNRITGANTIDTQEQALGIASLQQPVAQAGQGGILSSIFGGLF